MSDTTYVIGVDVGTASAKAIVTTDRGKILAQHSSAYGLQTPRPLWAEQWPEVWLDGLTKAVRGALEGSQIDAENVRAMTVSSLYGGSGIPVDNQMTPLHPCLIWMDRRAGDETAWVRENVPLDELFATTGNGVDSYYGFTKMLWLKHHQPEVWAKTRYFLPPNAYLIHRLTGEVAVDYSSAGNIGGVFDINKRAWSQEMTDALGIPLEVLPERLVASSEVVGELHKEGAEMLSLAPGTSVCAGGVDAAVATLSAGVFRPGQHAAMMGTSMCWGLIHPEKPKEPGLISMPYVLDPAMTYTFGGAATAGAVIKWFKDELGGAEQIVESVTKGGAGLGVNLDAYAQLDAKAARLPAGADGLLMLPYFMGERSPIWDTNARGTLLGLTLYHTRAHLYRAFLEGVAYALRHNIDTGRDAGYNLDSQLLVVGGGAKSALWNEVMASVTQMPVMAAAKGGEAALGDAMLAALGVGLISEADLPAWVNTADLYTRFEPDSQDAAVYDRYFEQYKGLYNSLKERFAAVAALGEGTSV